MYQDDNLLSTVKLRKYLIPICKATAFIVATGNRSSGAEPCPRHDESYIYILLKGLKYDWRNVYVMIDYLVYSSLTYYDYP